MLKPADFEYPIFSALQKSPLSPQVVNLGFVWPPALPSLIPKRLPTEDSRTIDTLRFEVEALDPGILKSFFCYPTVLHAIGRDS